MRATTTLAPFLPGMTYRRIHDGITAIYASDYTGELANMEGGEGKVVSLGQCKVGYFNPGDTIAMVPRLHWEQIFTPVQCQAQEIKNAAESMLDKGYDEGSLRKIPLLIEWEPFADLETGVEDSTLFRLYCSPESAAEIKPLLQMRGETIRDEYPTTKGYCIEWRQIRG